MKAFGVILCIAIAGTSAQWSNLMNFAKPATGQQQGGSPWTQFLQLPQQAAQGLTSFIPIGGNQQNDAGAGPLSSIFAVPSSLMSNFQNMAGGFQNPLDGLSSNFGKGQMPSMPQGLSLENLPQLNGFGQQLQGLQQSLGQGSVSDMLNQGKGKMPSMPQGLNLDNLPQMNGIGQQFQGLQQGLGQGGVSDFLSQGLGPLQSMTQGLSIPSAANVQDQMNQGKAKVTSALNQGKGKIGSMTENINIEQLQDLQGQSAAALEGQINQVTKNEQLSSLTEKINPDEQLANLQQ